MTGEYNTNTTKLCILKIMVAFKQFLARELKENRRNYGRLFRHFTSDPFVIIISVERNPYEVGVERIGKDHSLEKIVAAGETRNFTRTSELRTALKSIKNCGFIPVKGTYKEKYTYYKPFTNESSVDEIEVEEHSQIVYSTEQNHKQVWDLCWNFAKKTKQHSILVVEKGRAYYYFPNDSSKKPEPKGVFHPQQIGEYYTELHNGKRFSFSTDPSKLSNTLIKHLQITSDEIEQYRKQYQTELDKQSNQD